MPVNAFSRRTVLLAALLTALLLYLVGSRYRAAEPSGPLLAERLDLTYPIATGALQSFDMYAPLDYLSRRHPILIWIHGGGWSIGDKRDWLSVNLCRHAAGLGFVVFDVNYRLNTAGSPAPFPAAATDIAAFSRYLAAHLDLAHATQKTPLSIGGHSAGAHLALIEATDPSSPLRYACVIDVAGVTDLDAADLPGSLRRYVDAFAADRRTRREASPLLRAASWRSAAALFVHAGDDPVVPLGQSEAMAAALSGLQPAPRVEKSYPATGGHDLASEITDAALDRFLPRNCD